MGVSGKLYTAAALPSWKWSPVRNEQEVGKSESRFGCCVEKSAAPVGNQTPDTSVVDSFA